MYMQLANLPNTYRQLAV